MLLRSTRNVYCLFKWDWCVAVYANKSVAQVQLKKMKDENPGDRIWIDEVLYFDAEEMNK